MINAPKISQNVWAFVVRVQKCPPTIACKSQEKWLKTKGDGGKWTAERNFTTICDKRHDNLDMTRQLATFYGNSPLCVSLT